MSDVYSYSDHEAIIFEIRQRPTWNNIAAAPPNPLWRDSRFDRESFVLELVGIRLVGSANYREMGLMRYIMETWFVSRKFYQPGRKRVYWSNAEIADSREKGVALTA